MHPINLFLLFLAFIHPFKSVSSAQPFKTLVAPIHKDTKTSLFTLTLKQNYLLDLSAPLSWIQCPQPHPTVPCTSPQCTQATSYLSPLCPSPNNTASTHCDCTISAANPITKSCFSSQLSYNNITIPSTNGTNPSFNVYFSCANKSLVQSLPSGTAGIASLSWSPLSFPSQLGKKFAVCLPAASRGAAFFGDGPYNLPKRDAAKLLSYTPLIKNPKSPDYYIGVNAISINGDAISVGAKSLALDSSGRGGVKLSTVLPYTALRTDVYKAFLKGFEKAVKGLPKASKVKPFELCIKASSLGYTLAGLAVPEIDLQMANGKNWTIYGANSVVFVGKDKACLAFVDSGKKAEEAAVIGSFQMENYLLQFDLVQARLGFSSSLLLARATCGSFNVTSV
ncbi:probable aspartic proteinase GIP2 [Diospyros lotus]|uniref:probable aspartic proteinase GIP2 n=1 Tax=Diospyros lotus TaxID=55363 RepID=UPI0022581158|nr:probable aspartic proteinase GIP2 [Diospyros lotus]